jgi:hypothetical protein
MDKPDVTLEYIANRIAFMESDQQAPENLEIENKLYTEILSAIANGKCEKPRAGARLALKSKAFPFSRYVS